MFLSNKDRLALDVLRAVPELIKLVAAIRLTGKVDLSRDLADHMVGCGILDKDDDDRYYLSHVTELLLDGLEDMNAT